MSKKFTSRLHRPKKELDEEAMARLNPHSDQPASSSRKRLKKMSDVNHNEEIVDEDRT